MAMLRVFSILILSTWVSACMQTNNTSALDAQTYGNGSAVAAIFAQNCKGCHSYESMSADDLAAAGLLVKGDAQNSKIYYRLVGSSGAQGPKTMPQGGALSASDVAAIESWIAGL